MKRTATKNGEIITNTFNTISHIFIVLTFMYILFESIVNSSPILAFTRMII